MNKHSNPLDYVLDCAEQGLVPEPFAVQNAKDELKKLKEDNSRWLCCEKELSSLKPVAWGRINDRGDLYDLRTSLNPHIEEREIVPLYSNKVEFQNFYSKFQKKYEFRSK